MIFCCRENTSTKHGLVEVRSVVQVRILFSGSGAQSRTQRFKQSSKRTPTRRETGSELRLCRLQGQSVSRWRQRDSESARGGATAQLEQVARVWLEPMTLVTVKFFFISVFFAFFSLLLLFWNRSLSGFEVDLGFGDRNGEENIERDWNHKLWYQIDVKRVRTVISFKLRNEN